MRAKVASAFVSSLRGLGVNQPLIVCFGDISCISFFHPLVCFARGGGMIRGLQGVGPNLNGLLFSAALLFSQ